MDADIRHDLHVPPEESPSEPSLAEAEPTLGARIAVLLADPHTDLGLEDLADLLSGNLQEEETAALLIDLDQQRLTPGETVAALAEFAAERDAIATVAPMVAAITIQAMEPSAAEQMSAGQLSDLVESLAAASTELAAANGAETMALLPRILRVIHHHAQRNRLPPDELPSAVRRIGQQVAANPQIVDRLMAHQRFTPVQNTAQPGGGGREGKVQRIVIDRPAEITIRYLE